MERVALGSQQVPGFALGDPAAGGTVSPRYASLMTGAAAGLLAYVLDAPLWGSVVVGAAAAVVTKVSIDRTT